VNNKELSNPNRGPARCAGPASKPKAIFTSGGGREFRFSFVRRHRALRRALETGAPHISLEQRWDPNCAG